MKKWLTLFFNKKENKIKFMLDSETSNNNLEDLLSDVFEEIYNFYTDSNSKQFNISMGIVDLELFKEYPILQEVFDGYKLDIVFSRIAIDKLIKDNTEENSPLVKEIIFNYITEEVSLVIQKIMTLSKLFPDIIIDMELRY